MKNDPLSWALETVLDNLSLLDKEMLDKLQFALWVVQQEHNKNVNMNMKN